MNLFIKSLPRFEKSLYANMHESTERYTHHLAGENEILLHKTG
jgi:hypothetical protein